jgi:NADPH-dependent 2,4-dienoyl-CoA reductase/sulfur reductase-like enzyme
MTGYRGTWETGQRRNLRRILIVGGGRAGVAAAEELRRQGYGGELTIMCDEPDAPYDRPSCSKGILTGHKRPKDAKMPVMADLAIQWQMGRRAVHLDPDERVVVAENGEQYPYDGLVIASGARPVWPRGWPRDAAGLHQVHGIADAWRLRKELHHAKRVAVVGGGLTGCEVACSVRNMARKVTLIDSKQHLMSRVLGDVVGRYVTEEVSRHGVDLRLGRRFRELHRIRRGWLLVLDDGSEVRADLVVATIGERPDVQWLAESGLDISDGVLCDEHLRVVGAEDVVAAGTVARWPNLRYSAEPRRVGQWIMALEQGRAAAAALLRSDHPTRPAALVPRFWSEQFGLRVQVCGDIDNGAEVSVTKLRPGRKDTARAGVLVNYYRNGEQVGVVGVNAVRAFTDLARDILKAPPRLVHRTEQWYEERPLPALPPAAPRMIPAAVEARMLPPGPSSPGFAPTSPGFAPGGVPALDYAPTGEYPRVPAPRPPVFAPALPPAGYGPPPPGYPAPEPAYPPPGYPEPAYEQPAYPPDYPQPAYPAPQGYPVEGPIEWPTQMEFPGAPGWLERPEADPQWHPNGQDWTDPYGMAPVSPSVPAAPPPTSPALPPGPSAAPVSPASQRWRSPRDRFATDQFAAIR